MNQIDCRIGYTIFILNYLFKWMLFIIFCGLGWDTMNLQEVKLTNFKAFDSLDLELDGRSTVLAGVNGVGKSTVLAAIAYVMRIWLNRLNPAQGRAFETIPPDVISLGAAEASISCKIYLNGVEYMLARSRKAPVANSRGKGQSSTTKQYDAFIKSFRDTYLDSETRGMPIFVHYGVNRSVTSIPMGRIEDSLNDKLSALARAADSETNFQKFFEWYREQEAEEAIETRENDGYHNRSLALVREVIGDMVAGVTDLHVRRNPTRMTAVKDGKEIRVDLLSDGEKCTLALFGDLVKRLVLANPGADNPLEGEGVVLIDEIELHLHPSWQRQILGKLKKHFPRIQFIVSTHSPQVLGEANDEYNIFLIDGDSRDVRRVSRLDVFDSNFILEEYMGTASQNPLIGDMVEEVFQLTDNGEFEKARNAIDSLAELVGYSNRDYIVAQNYLKRGIYRHETH